MWAKFKASFANETIIWARVKAFLGMLFLAVTSSGVDLSLFLAPKHVALFQIFSTFLMLDGGVSEYLRRLRSGEEQE